MVGDGAHDPAVQVPQRRRFHVWVFSISGLAISLLSVFVVYLLLPLVPCVPIESGLDLPIQLCQPDPFLTALVQVGGPVLGLGVGAVGGWPTESAFERGHARRAHRAT
jgi:hypothetical protein